MLENGTAAYFVGGDVVVTFPTLTQFLGAFTKLRKATVSFVMSVHLSVRPSTWNNSDIRDI